MKKYIRCYKWLFVCAVSFVFVVPASAQWSYVGGNIAQNNTYPAHYSFTIDKAGTLYVAFADNASQYIVTVKKLHADNSWVTVGTPGFITGSGVFYNPGTSIAINPVDNMPYIAIADGDHDNKITVMKFNGTNWVYVGAPGFSSTSACYAKLLFTPKGTPYVSFNSCYDGSGISVMRFNGLQWTYVGAENFATGNYVNMSIARDSTISVAFQDQTNANKISVMQLYNGSWLYAGNAGFSDGVAESIKITTDTTNTPYVCYTDYSHSYKLTVKKLVAGVWTTVGDPYFSTFEARATDININKYNVPFVSYVEGSFPVGQQFKNGAWKRLSNYIETTKCSFTSVINDSLGLPYVLMGLQPLSNNLPFIRKYSPCSDTDYHFVAKAEVDSAIKKSGDSTTVKVTATGGQPPYKGTGTFKVPAGSYTYNVTDGSGCTTNVSFQVAAPCTQNNWIGGSGSAWENAANWSCGTVPNLNSDVVIQTGTVILQVNTTVRSLRVNPGVNFIVNPGVSLTVKQQ